MEKLVKDGMVAVIYSPGFGAGWSTWADKSAEAFVFDKRIAEAVLEGDLDKAAEVACEISPDAYLGGARDLQVKWLPVGTAFRINEYDGSESIEVLGEVDWMTA